MRTLLLALLLAPAGAESGSSGLHFTPHTIATGLRGGYQVLATDVDADGRVDLIALASGMSELVWYRNPGWERYVLAEGRRRMIHGAAADTDGDRIPEIVLAEEFDNDPANSVGIVSLLAHEGDPRAPWRVREIDRLSTSHRLRVVRAAAGLLFINAPLAGEQARPPAYRAPVPVVAYRPGIWEREVIDRQSEGVRHGLAVTDWNSDGRDDLLTAGFEGIHLFRQANRGWRKRLLTTGAPGEWGKGGTSDVEAGRLGGRRFLAAIEPWHGNQVVVYSSGRSRRTRRLIRHVIDDRRSDGHALVVADFDGDGSDEIVVGFRRGQAVVLYRAADARGWKWQPTVIDETISAAGCTASDLNADGRPDIACIGSATGELKWYENRPLP